MLTLGAVRTLMMTPLYEATVRLQIDRNVAKVVESGNVTPVEGTDFEFLKTQYELLQSRTMAERVAVSLKLGDDADFLQPTGFSLIGYFNDLLSSQGPHGAEAAQAAPTASAPPPASSCKRRSVRPISGSRLVDVSYPDPSPWRAQKIATASPTPSSPRTSTSASRLTPTPRPSSRISSSS